MQQIQIVCITYNKRFWKTMKPLLSDKNIRISQVTVVKKRKLLLIILNNFFDQFL